MFDSFNARCLLPTSEYAPGIPPPPHLSPFVDNVAEGYVPARAKEIARYQAAAEGIELPDDDDMNTEPTTGPYAAKYQLYRPGTQDDDAVPAAKDTASDDEQIDDAADNDDEEVTANASDDDNEDNDQDDTSGSDDDDDDDEKMDNHEKIALAAIADARRAQLKASMTPEERRYQRELEAEAKGVQFSAHEKVEAKIQKTERNTQHRTKQTENKERRFIEVGMMPKKDRKLYLKTVSIEKRKNKRVRRLTSRAEPEPGTKRQKQE